ERLVRAVANVRSVAAVRAFYLGSLGFEDHGGGRLLIPGNSGDEVELHATSAEARPRIVFAVPDVARATEELRRRGLAPVASAGAGRVVDPDGAVMVFTAEGSPADDARQIPSGWTSV